MVELETTDAGVLIPVQAQPKSRRNAVTGVHAGRLKVAVTQAPEKGKANLAVLKTLAAALDLRRSQLTLVAGETSTHKKILVTGVSREQVAELIADCLTCVREGGCH